MREQSSTPFEYRDVPWDDGDDMDIDFDAAGPAVLPPLPPASSSPPRPLQQPSPPQDPPLPPLHLMPSLPSLSLPPAPPAPPPAGRVRGGGDAGAGAGDVFLRATASATRAAVCQRQLQSAAAGNPAAAGGGPAAVPPCLSRHRLPPHLQPRARHAVAQAAPAAPVVPVAAMAPTAEAAAPADLAAPADKAAEQAPAAAVQPAAQGRDGGREDVPVSAPVLAPAGVAPAMRVTSPRGQATGAPANGSDGAGGGSVECSSAAMAAPSHFGGAPVGTRAGAGGPECKAAAGDGRGGTALAAVTPAAPPEPKRPHGSGGGCGGLCMASATYAPEGPPSSRPTDPHTGQAVAAATATKSQGGTLDGDSRCGQWGRSPQRPGGRCSPGDGRPRVAAGGTRHASAHEDARGALAMRSHAAHPRDSQGRARKPGRGCDWEQEREQERKWESAPGRAHLPGRRREQASSAERGGRQLQSREGRQRGRDVSMDRQQWRRRLAAGRSLSPSPSGRRRGGRRSRDERHGKDEEAGRGRGSGRSRCRSRSRSGGFGRGRSGSRVSSRGHRSDCDKDPGIGSKAAGTSSSSLRSGGCEERKHVPGDPQVSSIRCDGRAGTRKGTGEPAPPVTAADTAPALGQRVPVVHADSKHMPSKKGPPVGCKRGSSGGSRSGRCGAGADPRVTSPTASTAGGEDPPQPCRRAAAGRKGVRNDPWDSEDGHSPATAPPAGQVAVSAGPERCRRAEAGWKSANNDPWVSRRGCSPAAAAPAPNRRKVPKGPGTDPWDCPTLHTKSSREEDGLSSPPQRRPCGGDNGSASCLKGGPIDFMPAPRAPVVLSAEAPAACGYRDGPARNGGCRRVLLLALPAPAPPPLLRVLDPPPPALLPRPPPPPPRPQADAIADGVQVHASGSLHHRSCWEDTSTSQPPRNRSGQAGPREPSVHALRSHVYPKTGGAVEGAGETTTWWQGGRTAGGGGGQRGGCGSSWLAAGPGEVAPGPALGSESDLEEGEIRA